MKEILNTASQQFISDRDMMKDIFKWENTYIIPVSAMMLKGKADEEKIQYCKKLVKKNKGVFSGFRGNVLLPLVAKLALDPSPDEKLEKISKIYDALKKYFFGNESLVFTATLLADIISPEEAMEVSAKGKQIYKLMSKEHPFLTSSEDNVFAVLMALSEKSEKALITEMEDCYKYLKKPFGSGNSVQTLSHILSLADGDYKEKSQRIVDIYNGLKDAGRKYSKYFELSVLASLALTDMSVNEIVSDILDVDAFLSEQEGYGFWSIDKKTRLMHSAMIVAGVYADSEIINAAVVTGTLAMLAAQQAAMLATISASSASAAAASSN
ncbi:MAG: DUF4003 family protein [Ruminiclostridium sp.]|nr:DUF4003 family protein [Ruminiclostridium sp.]